MKDKISRYNEEISALFEEWRHASGTVDGIFIDHSASVFIEDGVVCPEEWFSQSVRPLFLLKEAYGGESDWNLTRDFLGTCKRPMSKMWRRVSLFAKGLLGTSKHAILPFDENDTGGTYAECGYLKKIAVVNIKKSNGAKSSDMEMINAYARLDCARLKRQLELCDPTVIVCGYTAYMLDSISGYSVRAQHDQNGVYGISLNGRNVPVLDYWHPANRYPDIMNYYGLMGIYQLALE